MKADESLLQDTIEGLRRENKNLTQEIRDLSDQLGEGGRSVHEMQKIIRRVELENEELEYTRRNHALAMESMQASLEVGARAGAGRRRGGGGRGGGGGGRGGRRD